MAARLERRSSSWSERSVPVQEHPLGRFLPGRLEAVVRATLVSSLQGAPIVRVAVPLFGDEISPRFCFAQHALIVDWSGTTVERRVRARLGKKAYPERLEILARRSVAMLLCGGFPAEHLGEAERLGIRVVCGAAGVVPESDAELASLLGAFVGAHGAGRPAERELGPRRAK